MAGRKEGSFVQGARVAEMRAALRKRLRGMSVKELAEEFHMSERQIRRDLVLLEKHGEEIEHVTGAGEPKRFRLRTAEAKPIQLPPGERYALLAVRHVFNVLEHTPLHRDLGSVYDKLTASLPPDKRSGMEHDKDRFVFLPDGGTKRYEGSRDVLDELTTGVIRRFRVTYTYRNVDGKQHTGVLEPYSMVLWRQGLYVVGKREGCAAPRVFAVERFVKAAHQRKKRFVVPAGFSIDDHFKGVFGIFVATRPPIRVVVEFSARCAKYVRGREWHPDQVVTDLANGGVQLSFDVTDTTQVLPWVLSWGSEARLLEPLELVAEVARNGEELARHARSALRARDKKRARAEGT